MPSVGARPDLGDVDLTDLDRFAQGAPHDVFRALRERAPVFWQEPTEHTPDREGFWSLTRYDDVLWAATAPDVFSSESGGARDGGGTILEDLPLDLAAGVLLNMQDDPRHQHIRRLVTPAVSPRRLREIESDLRARADSILDDVAARGSCDFLVDVAAELPVQAIAALMGIPQADRHLLIGWADATLDYEDRELGQQSPRAQQAAAEMAEYGTELLAEKRRCPADDILSSVVTAEIPSPDGGSGPLTDLEQQMFFNLLIAAGSETTRNSITAGMLALIERPDQWRKLQQDRAGLTTAIEEMLRWSSATTYNRRTATVDVERHGVTIATGDKVLLWWASANYDEQKFDHPERFDITREPNPHLTFGYGSHFCLGANLARVEMKLVFDGLLDRFESLELAGPVERTRSNKHTGFRHMPVSLTARTT